MRIGIIALSAVVFAVLLSGCLGPELKDCGTDAACFAEAMAVCEPAKVRQEMPAATGSTTMYAEVRGGTMDSCTFYYKLTDATIPSDATAEERAEIMAFIGSDMTCVAPVQTFTAGMQDGSLIESCEGALKDLMMEWIQGAGRLPTSVTPADREGEIMVSVESCYSLSQVDVEMTLKNIGSTTIIPEDQFLPIEQPSGNAAVDCIFSLPNNLRPGETTDITLPPECNYEDMPPYRRWILMIQPGEPYDGGPQPTAQFVC